jgi:hypothetical protein
LSVVVIGVVPQPLGVPRKYQSAEAEVPMATNAKVNNAVFFIFALERIVFIVGLRIILPMARAVFLLC